MVNRACPEPWAASKGWTAKLLIYLFIRDIRANSRYSEFPSYSITEFPSYSITQLPSFLVTQLLNYSIT